MTCPIGRMITACAIVATVLQLLDQTIANVALPYMQGSFSASFDEITWVLTSYITASAIMTAPVGWLAARYGRKLCYVACILGFTITSMLCGAAQSLGQIVVFRVLQGVFGAALVPLSQATLLDIYPPEQRGFAMAIWGVGVMLGPIMGPTVGGWLTETYNWRWVFYINLPFGLLAAAGLMIFLPGGGGQARLRFDWLGFGVLTVGIGAMQLMLDRGQDQDWFTSPEIITEAVLAGLGFYLFLVHVLSARAAADPACAVPGRQFRVRRAADVHGRHLHGLQPGADDAVAADPEQLPRRNRRADHGAARVRQPGDHHAGRTAGVPRGREGAGGDGTGHALLLVLADDALDAGRIRARDHRRDHHPGRRDGAAVHADPVTGVRYPGAVDADRGRRLVQPAAQPRVGDRGVGRDGDAGAQYPGDA